MLVSQNATKGGGGMDIATKRDALANAFRKAAKQSDPKGRLSDQDIARAMSMARGMINPKKAKGGKVKK